LALYGDVEACAEAHAFVPTIRLFSGRVADTDEGEDTELLENRVARAVSYFVENYGCKIFNLSFGDERRPYRGGHLDRFAATLDTIAREQKVLFIVAAGNFRGTAAIPHDWRRGYPDYLLTDEARIIDPAPSLNSLTVGSLARHEASRMAVRFPDDPAYQPIARRDQPSPFSRSGLLRPSAIKPELADYGGNLYVDTRIRPARPDSGRELGELTTNEAFASEGLFTIDSGTSFAAPKVSNLAARILAGSPDASPNLLRALIVAHARIPEATAELLGGDRDKLLRLVGYGRPQDEPAQYSSERCVTLLAEESLDAEQHHFYEIPLPEDFFTPGRRERIITVAIAHCPSVRRTRLEYKHSALSFRVVRAASLEEVTRAYRRLGRGETEPSIPETGFAPPPTLRAPGTVQRASRKLMNPPDRDKQFFVVVTHRRAPWAPTTTDPEPYALVVVLEDRSEIDVQLYAQIQAQLRARARAVLTS